MLYVHSFFETKEDGGKGNAKCYVFYNTHFWNHDYRPQAL